MPALPEVLTVVRAIVLSEVSLVFPSQYSSPAPPLPLKELKVMVPLVPKELLEPDVPILLTWSLVELAMLTPPPNELLVLPRTLVSPDDRIIDPAPLIKPELVNFQPELSDDIR